MSPWTDLALTGDSFETRADADPIFTRGVLQAFADAYLQGQDATDPKASPLYAQLGDLPPIRIDVGEDEVLLADSVRYADRARAAGVDDHAVGLGGYAARLPIFPRPFSCSREVGECHR